MRWLALDIGAARVGVAISDAEETVVTPLAPLVYRGTGRLAEDVAALVERWSAEGVVVGVPVTRRGGGRGEKRAAAVVEALRERLAVRVETADERGTTVEAEEMLRQAGVARRRWRGLVDGLAARAVLERWLDSRERIR